MLPPGDSPRSSVVPRASYRVQLHAGFTFDDAAAVADYLRDLGISHLYLSPVLQAAPGSTHGYDVVDPTRVSTEFGGPEGHLRLQEALGAAGIGQLLDIVPNHMAVGGRGNVWWWDVLENGPSSQYATYFDVDWDPPESKLRNTVLLPILGDHYGRELEAGHLRVAREGGGFVLQYFDHAAPLSPRSLDDLLTSAAHRLAEDAPESAPGVAPSEEASAGAPREALESIANALQRLPVATDTDPSAMKERQRDKEILRSRLGDLCVTNPEVGDAIDVEVAALNGDVDRLDALLERQNFRVAWWKTAGEELDYRRFFDINDLAGLRVEDPEVFQASHRLILSWLHSGVIDGVRIDHVDGLLDPEGYLDRLAAAAPEAWVVVEKILEAGESLPESWAVAGTTGYDWLNLVGNIFDDPDGCEQLAAVYRLWTGVTERYEEMVHAAKHAVIDGPLAADLRRLANCFALVCESHRRYRDYTGKDLTDTLAEVLCGFGVYRTYLRMGQVANASDVLIVENAILAAGIRRQDLDDELLGFVRDLLLLRVPGNDEEHLALRFQQVSGPVMAKAVEDTAFYRYLPVTWRNEVGGDPGRRPASVAEVHRAVATAQRLHPHALLATSTHDTKRAEDVRARLAVLAEMPQEWADTAERWRAANEARATVAPPDRNTEWLLYQTLVGAWPITAERATAYMQKATREAKVHTSWTQPDEYYDQSLQRFIEEMLADVHLTADIDDFVTKLLRPGWTVALGQKLMTLTSPGTPDLYQGSECWDLSLVDPDNRRPVDYGLRRRLLEAAKQTSPAAAWAKESGDGATKVGVVHAALRLRAANPSWFGPGEEGHYQPLAAAGPAAEHMVGFVRGGRAATVVTRLPWALAAGGGWQDTTVELPEGRWFDRMSVAPLARRGPAAEQGRTAEKAFEGRVSLSEMLAGLPVALLVREGDR